MKPKSGGQIVFMQEQKTQLLYGDIQSLYTKKQLLEADRELYKGVVTITSDFSAPTRRENGITYYSRQIVPVLFCITLVILILLSGRKKLYEVFNKY